MRVSSLKKESTGEVRGHFADIIYFQGCSKHCCYCFNPTLMPREGGERMDDGDIWNEIKDSISDVLVFTGGEPLEQSIIPLFRLMIKARYKKRKIVLETCRYHELISNSADKVLFTIKTFDIDVNAIKKLRDKENVDFCVVIGHDCFDMDGYKFAHRLAGNKPIYHRFNNDIPQNFNELFRYTKSLKKNFLVFNKIDL